jgi:hypothetical protein
LSESCAVRSLFIALFAICKSLFVFGVQS